MELQQGKKQENLMTKVLFVLTPALNPIKGGVQRTTMKLGKYFDENGIKVSYFSFAKMDHATIENGELFHSEYEGGLTEARNIRALRTCISNVGPDIVINQMPYELLLTSKLGEYKRELNFILIGCLRNSLFSVVNNIDDFIKEVSPRFLVGRLENRLGRFMALAMHWLKHRYMLRKILRFHDKYVLLAPPNIKELNFFVGGYKKEKIHCIPNSIPRLNEDVKKKKILLHVGRIDEAQKRSDLLLEVWRRCEKEIRDWEFVVIGDGPYMAKLEAQARAMNLTHIKLLGFTNPSDYYGEASIFMMPSSFEGFPNTILEAHSYGVPVVAFDSYPALRWIVNDKIDSYVISPFDTKEMAESIINLARNRSLRFEMSKAAYRNAERFTIEEVGKMWLEFFSRIGNEKLDK